MKLRALILDAETGMRIIAAIAKARANPTPLDAVKRMSHGAPADQKGSLKLADREPGYRSEAHPQQVLITNGYRAAISFEQQPAGLCSHLSVSVDTPGKLPSKESVEMIAEAFGLKVPLTKDNTMFWVEEFDPGHEAVNLLQVVPA